MSLPTNDDKGPMAKGGSLSINMPMPVVKDEGITTQEGEATGASRSSQDVSENELSGVPGANPVDMPSSVGLSTPSDEYILPKAVYHARTLVASEGQVSEDSYVTLESVAKRQSSLSGSSNDGLGVKDVDLASGLQVRAPVPRPMRPMPTREAKFTVHFIRHGQAAHNISNLVEAYSMRNPGLTTMGHLQCETVLKTFPHMDKITHILCSPLTRTLETALECFKPVFERGVKITAWHQLVELGNNLTNKGDPLPKLKEKMAGLPVELSFLTEDWENISNAYSDGHARAYRAAKTLHAYCQVVSRRGEKASDRLDVDLVVVSHANFLRHLLREHPHFANCQVRTCEFASDDQIRAGASWFDLFETDESKAISSELDWTELRESMKTLNLAQGSVAESSG